MANNTKTLNNTKLALIIGIIVFVVMVNPFMSPFGMHMRFFSFGWLNSILMTVVLVLLIMVLVKQLKK